MDPVLGPVNAITSSFVQDRRTRAVYNAFVYNPNPKTHRAFCDYANTTIVARLSELRSVQRRHDAYVFHFPDSNGLDFHRLPFNLRTMEYYDYDPKKEFESWNSNRRRQKKTWGRLTSVFFSPVERSNPTVDGPSVQIQGGPVDATGSTTVVVPFTVPSPSVVSSPSTMTTPSAGGYYSANVSSVRVVNSMESTNTLMSDSSVRTNGRAYRTRGTLAYLSSTSLYTLDYDPGSSTMGWLSSDASTASGTVSAGLVPPGGAGMMTLKMPYVRSSLSGVRQVVITPSSIEFSSDDYSGGSFPITNVTATPSGYDVTVENTSDYTISWTEGEYWESFQENQSSMPSTVQGTFIDVNFGLSPQGDGVYAVTYDYTQIYVRTGDYISYTFLGQTMNLRVIALTESGASYFMSVVNVNDTAATWISGTVWTLTQTDAELLSDHGVSVQPTPDF